MSVLGKQPAVTVKIGDAVLPFSIDGFVEVLPDDCAFAFCFLAMSSDVRNDNGEHLSAITKRRRALAATVTRAIQHDVGIAQIHLDAANRVAVAIVLRESEDACEPGTGLGQVAVHKMRKHGSGGHRAVIHDDTMMRKCAHISRRFFAVPAEK